MFLHFTRKYSVLWGLSDQKVACSASDFTRDYTVLCSLRDKAVLHINPNKALASRASGVNKLLALIGCLVALKFCLLKDHFDQTH